MLLFGDRMPEGSLDLYFYILQSNSTDKKTQACCSTGEATMKAMCNIGQ